MNLDAILTHISRGLQFREKAPAIFVAPLIYMAQMSRTLRDGGQEDAAESVNREREALVEYSLEAGEVIRLLVDDLSAVVREASQPNCN